MFRAKRASQPKIPQIAIQFFDQLPTTNFAIHLKASVILSEHIAVIFFSENICEVLGDISDIQFDGTFYVVPNYSINCLQSFFYISKNWDCYQVFEIYPNYLHL